MFRKKQTLIIRIIAILIVIGLIGSVGIFAFFTVQSRPSQTSGQGPSREDTPVVDLKRKK